jgi:N utilization substance protein B
MSTINSKTASRIAALQALYQFEVNKDQDDIDSVLKNIEKSYEEKDFKATFEIPRHLKVKLHKKHLSNLVKNAVENTEFIDETIKSNLSKDWKFSNLHLSLVSLLRVAIAELVYVTETPYKVVINEFTNIGTGFLQDFEISFINSILDKIAKKHRTENDQQL